MTDSVAPIYLAKELERKIDQAAEDARRHARYLRLALDRADKATRKLDALLVEFGGDEHDG